MFTKLVVNENEIDEPRQNAGAVKLLRKLDVKRQGLPFFALLDRKGDLITYAGECSRTIRTSFANPTAKEFVPADIAQGIPIPRPP